MISRGLLPLGHMTLETGLMSVRQGRGLHCQATQISLSERSRVSALATEGCFGFTFGKTSRSFHKIWKSNPNPRQISVYILSPGALGRMRTSAILAEASRSTASQDRLCPAVTHRLLNQQRVKNKGCSLICFSGALIRPCFQSQG